MEIMAFVLWIWFFVFPRSFGRHLALIREGMNEGRE
jgi:hypothetical protein